MSLANGGQVDAGEDEISIFEIIEFIKAKWKTLVVVSLVVVLTGLIYALLAPKKYEATAYVKMATVGGTIVEDPVQLTEKLKLPTFFSDKTLAACQQTEAKSPGEDLVKALNPSLNKKAPIVTISYKSLSVSEAKQCVEAVVEDVKTSQQTLAKPVFDAKTSLLKTLKDKLAAEEDSKQQFIITKKTQLKTLEDKLAAAEEADRQFIVTKKNQLATFEGKLASAEETDRQYIVAKEKQLATLEEKLASAEESDRQYILVKESQLKTLKQKLAAAEERYSKFSKNDVKFDFSDTQFSASSLLLSTILKTEDEIKDINNQITDIELFLASPQTPRADEIKELKEQISVIKLFLSSPQTPRINEIKDLKEQIAAVKLFLSSPQLPNFNEIKDLKDKIEGLQLFLESPQVPNDKEIRDLTVAISDLTIELAEPKTEQTSLFAPIYAPEFPVEPKRGLIVALSGVMGLMLALIWIFLQAGWQRARNKSVPAS